MKDIWIPKIIYDLYPGAVSVAGVGFLFAADSMYERILPVFFIVYSLWVLHMRFQYR